MTRTMTMTIKTLGHGEAAAMARTRADGTQFVRRVVNYAVLASGVVAIAAQSLAHLVGH